MAITAQNWFSFWFDTPYYHILYKDRGYSEAQLFMKNLTSFLNLKNIPVREVVAVMTKKSRLNATAVFLSIPI